MTISDVRADLLNARQAAREGDLPETLRRLDRALDHITPERLLTGAEAAALLDIHSPTVVLGWCRTGFLHGVMRGDQTMIPLAEIERIQESDQVRAIRA